MRDQISSICADTRACVWRSNSWSNRTKVIIHRTPGDGHKLALHRSL